MARPPYTEKGSRRIKLFKGLLHDDSFFCNVCLEHSSYCDVTLRSFEKTGNFAVFGVCKDILGTLSPEIIAKREEFLMDNGRGRRRRKKVTAYTPNHQIKSGKSNPKKFKSPLEKITALTGLKKSDMYTNDRGGQSSSTFYRDWKRCLSHASAALETSSRRNTSLSPFGLRLCNQSSRPK